MMMKKVPRQQISTIKHAIARLDKTQRDTFVGEVARSGTQTGEAIRSLMDIEHVGAITALEVLLAVIGKCEGAG